MPRILLVLARETYRARAFLEAAGRAGVDAVVASDHRPSLRAHAPDHALTVRFDDVSRSVGAIERLARRRPLDALIAAEDDGAVLAAEAAVVLGLRHASPEAVRVARDKATMRTRMSEAGLPVPAFTVVGPDEEPTDAASRVPYPCVLKPRSLSASRGVIRADDASQFAVVLGRVREIAARAKPEVAEAGILVEAFLPGAEVAVEGVLTGGRLHVLAILDKPDPLDGPYFEETLLVTPSRLPGAVQTEIGRHVHEVATAIGLTEGPVHAELRIDGERIRLLELAPRSIGGRCSRILRFGHGSTLEDVLLAAALGAAPEAAATRGASGVLMLPIPRRGVLRGVDGQARARMVPHVEDLEITVPVGREVVPPPEGSAYLGFLFARAPTPELVERALRDAHGRLDIRIEEP